MQKVTARFFLIIIQAPLAVFYTEIGIFSLHRLGVIKWHRTCGLIRAGQPALLRGSFEKEKETSALC
jgi:hypothetical protein